MKYIIFTLCNFTFNAFAGGPSSLICEENCPSDDKLGGIFLIGLAVGVIYFGWLIWGRKSLKFIYIPVAIGCTTILLFDAPIRSYFLFPVGGLIVGWAIIGIFIFVFKCDYFGNKEGSSVSTFVVGNSSLNTQQFTHSKPVKPHLEPPETANHDRSVSEKDRELKLKKNPIAIYDVANWSDKMLETALLNSTYSLPMYKNTLIKIESELAKRGLLKDLKNK